MTFSTDASVDPDAAASLAHVMLESEIEARISAIRELAKQRNAIHEALAAYEEGWSAAVKAGWTTEQLQKIGLKETEFEKSADPRPAVAAVPAVPAVAAVAPVTPVAPYAAPVALSTDYRSDTVTSASHDSSFGGPVAVPYTN